MTGYVTLKTTVPHDSGLAEDSVVMTTHWMHSDPSRDALAVAVDAWQRMDNFLGALAGRFSSSYAPHLATYKAYDLLTSPPRVPIVDQEATFAAPTPEATDFPAELAVVISYSASVESGQNARRRRGRFYFGPLSFTVGSTDFHLVPSTHTILFADAAEDYLLDPPGDARWAVYSPSTAHGVPIGGSIPAGEPEDPDLIPGSFAAVARLWVDNAWDVQRRRGLKATARETRS